MKPSVKKLQNIFKLEADREYDNGAVFGGLDKYLETWEPEARADQLNEALIQATLARIRDYPRLSQKSREESLKGLWRRFKREEEIPSTELEPPAAREEMEGRDPPLAPSPDSPSPVLDPQGDPEMQVDHPSHVEEAVNIDQPVLEAVEPHEDVEQGQLPATSSPVLEPEPPRIEPVEQPVSLQDDDSPIAGDISSEDSEPPPKFEQPAALEASVTVLPGIGERHAQTLARLNLHTLGDLLYHFPRRYDDYTQLKPINRLWYGEEVTVIGTVEKVGSRRIHGRKLEIIEAFISDGSGTLRVTWFNQPWIAKRLRPGTLIVTSGKIDQYLGRLMMTNPEWELLERDNLHTNRIVPVYPLTARLTQRWLRRIMHKVVSYWAPRVNDPLPRDLRERAGLMDISTALLQAHFPDSWEQLREARHRLAFDEIFLLQLGVLRQKRAWQERSARVFGLPEDWLAGQLSHLPFSLTGAQEKAFADVRKDLASGRPMNRLLQGDVGSGKTVIAALGIAAVGREGAQAAVLAPTGILAEQHEQSLRAMLVREGGFAPDEIRLMLGSTPEAEKRDIRERLAVGEVKLVIGTHALLEDPVNFADLELVVIDEQHRFGVQQRAALRAKGANPHLLVMTATPIPRSLSLTIYGDLDLSIIDEMPPGRLEVDTNLIYPTERERAYTLIRSEVAGGRQAFIIYPLVEESEKTEALAAVEEYERLRKDVFPGLNLGLLHGRLKADEKERVMAGFRDRETQILVSTSVVEVGVDVPNASVMLIEGANRFGLAQLHQFRGRVGRGADKSYCLLVPQDSDAAENERLAAMVETNDGFILAEKDLAQRGPGDFLGVRQSGFAQLQMANLMDVHLIEKARREAQALVENDPDLINPAYQHLVEALDVFWQAGRGDIS